MKKVLLVGIMFLMFMGVVSASSINGEFEGNPIVKLTLDGKEVKADDVPAMIYNNRTVIPVYLLKKMGMGVTWDLDSYSADIKLPQNNISPPDNSEIKRKVMAANLFEYFQEVTRYNDAFIGLMDEFYSTENEKGFNPNDYTTLNKFMDDTTAEINKASDKYNSTYLSIDVNDANEAFKNFNDMMDIYNILKDAFIDMTAWKMDKYESNLLPKVYPGFYTSYSTKVQSAHSKALTITSTLENNYNASISAALNY